MQKTLSSDFVVELIKLSLTDSKVLDICRDYVKFQYFYTDVQKKVFKFILDYYNVNKCPPTIGIIGQSFTTDGDVIGLLSKIKSIVIDKSQYDAVLSTLESFIIDSKFRILYDRIGDLYNEGRQEEAIKLLGQESQEIQNFQLKDSYYTRVFQDFEKRQSERIQNSDTKLLDKLTFGIHELDDMTRGGFEKGTSLLIMARSGVGKSTFLRWLGLCNARLGRRVIHFQAEGTERECLEAYDAGWTSISLNDIELGMIPESKKDKILHTQRAILSNGGEIYVYASEMFDSMSINECREIMLDIEKLHGSIDLALFDYLELFTVKGQFGNSESSERKRREEIANKMTNIGVEFNCGIATAIQSMDIAPAVYNNDEFVMTRHHASEFKNIIKPFSTFLTLNQTDDEYEEEVVRVHVDKFRKFKKPKAPVMIYQSRSNGRFYNAAKTLEVFYVNKV